MQVYWLTVSGPETNEQTRRTTKEEHRCIIPGNIFPGGGPIYSRRTGPGPVALFLIKNITVAIHTSVSTRANASLARSRSAGKFKRTETRVAPRRARRNATLFVSVHFSVVTKRVQLCCVSKGRPTGSICHSFLSNFHSLSVHRFLRKIEKLPTPATSFSCFAARLSKFRAVHFNRKFLCRVKWIGFYLRVPTR